MPEFKDINTISSSGYVTDQNTLTTTRIQVGYDQYTTLQDVANLAYGNNGRAISSYRNYYYSLGNVGNGDDTDIENTVLTFNSIYGISGELPDGRTELNLNIDASARAGMKESYLNKGMPILLVIPFSDSSIASRIKFNPTNFSGSNSRVTMYRQYNGVINPGIVNTGTLVISISQCQAFSYGTGPTNGNLLLMVTYSWLELLNTFGS